MQLQEIWDYSLQYCINKGLTKEEMDFYRIIPNLRNVTNQAFLSELAWCIYNAGMKMEVIRKKWPALKEAFMEFDPHGVIYNSAECLKAALDTFNHPGKAGAVIAAAFKIIAGNPEREIGCKLSDMCNLEVLVYLQTYPFIGNITKYHLAKNLGFDVVKPDRHLVRLT